LERYRADVERPDLLRPAQCRELIAACLRHDAATIELTRKEHAGEGEPGTTARYDVIAPFVCIALLTGMRWASC
jgi:hypothetical protein